MPATRPPASVGPAALSQLNAPYNTVGLTTVPGGGAQGYGNTAFNGFNGGPLTDTYYSPTLGLDAGQVPPWQSAPGQNAQNDDNQVVTKKDLKEFAAELKKDDGGSKIDPALLMALMSGNKKDDSFAEKMMLAQAMKPEGKKGGLPDPLGLFGG